MDSGEIGTSKKQKVTVNRRGHPRPEASTTTVSGILSAFNKQRDAAHDFASTPGHAPETAAQIYEPRVWNYGTKPVGGEDSRNGFEGYRQGEVRGRRPESGHACEQRLL